MNEQWRLGWQTNSYELFRTLRQYGRFSSRFIRAQARAASSSGDA
jgi:hypothetical protein